MDPNDDDPMVQLFGEGVDQFVLYEKTRDENYKSRSERHRAKLDRLHKDLADPQLRKIRNKQRRDAEKARLSAQLNKLSPQEVTVYL